MRAIESWLAVIPLRRSRICWLLREHHWQIGACLTESTHSTLSIPSQHEQSQIVVANRALEVIDSLDHVAADRRGGLVGALSCDLEGAIIT